MTAKKYCMNTETIAYYYGLNGLEIKGIEYGIEDYLYCVSGAWGGHKSYHRLKIYSTTKGDLFIRLYGHRVPLSECLRVGV